MARRHYSTKDFFRHIPNALLARYFQRQGLFAELDFAAMPEGKPDALFNAWLALAEKQRHPLDMQFRQIFEVSCQKGFQAIIDEASWQFRGVPEEATAFIQMLSILPSHYFRAMITFLDYPELWKGATRFYHADTSHPLA